MMMSVGLIAGAARAELRGSSSGIELGDRLLPLPLERLTGLERRATGCNNGSSLTDRNSASNSDTLPYEI